MITHISFDFWNTLFISHDSNTIRRESERLTIFTGFAARHGVSLTDDQASVLGSKVWDYFDEIWNNEWRTPLATELLDFMCLHAGVKAPREHLEETAMAMGDLIINTPPALTDSYLLKLIPALAEDFQLSIISDTGFSPGSALRKVLDREGLLPYFSVFAFSDEIGRSKPHPSMFDAVIGDNPPEHLLHIGDIGGTDIRGAKDFGAKAIRYVEYNDSPAVSVCEDKLMEKWTAFPRILEELSGTAVKL